VSLRNWVRALKRDVVALWLAARDRRTPKLPKVIAAIVAGYVLSPIDLIPDFVPVLGQVDDLLIVPAGIWLAVRLIPPTLMSEFRAAAERVRPGASRAVLFVILAVWCAVVTIGLSALLRTGNMSSVWR